METELISIELTQEQADLAARVLAYTVEEHYDDWDKCEAAIVEIWQEIKTALYYHDPNAGLVEHDAEHPLEICKGMPVRAYTNTSRSGTILGKVIQTSKPNDTDMLVTIRNCAETVQIHESLIIARDEIAANLFQFHQIKIGTRFVYDGSIFEKTSERCTIPNCRQIGGALSNESRYRKQDDMVWIVA